MEETPCDMIAMEMEPQFVIEEPLYLTVPQYVIEPAVRPLDLTEVQTPLVILLEYEPLALRKAQEILYADRAQRQEAVHRQ